MAQDYVLQRKRRIIESPLAGMLAAIVLATSSPVLRTQRRVWLIAICVLALIAPAVSTAALTKCSVGQQVIDPLGKNGIVDWSGGDFCRVRYEGGVSHGWTAASLRAVDLPAKADVGSNSTTSQPSVARGNASPDDIILRPNPSALVYHADPLGHFRLTATVNGAPIRAFVDTGATVVSLSIEDAAAAGIDPHSLAFTVKMHTANGPTRAAPVMLRSVGIGPISVNDVPGLVAEKLNSSLLGMSFLNRLKGFEIREGSLTISR